MTGDGRPARRRWLLPIVAATFALGLALAFPDLALLFVVAILIVYLIDPLVAAMIRVPFRGRRLPRWGAVITVYTLMVGATVAFAAIFGPIIAGEAAALAEDVPEFVHEVRTRHAPRINSTVSSLRSMLAPEVVIEVPVEQARVSIAHAVEAAHLEALFASALGPEERAAYRSGALIVDADVPVGETGDVLFRIRDNADGTFDVLAGDEAVRVQPTGEGAWMLTTHPVVPSGAGDVDIAGALTDSLTGALETSGRQVAEVLHVGQRVITGLVSALVGIFVTFMVAAFISIDVPRIVGFLTSLFPPENQPAVARLLSRLNHGLSGVIRGQLAICVINAFLTGLGLLIFDVKFALLLAIIAGFFSLIPIFGTILSTIPAVLLALPQGIGTALLVIAWIIVIHFIEANILQPKIMGETARIHPAAVILALVAGEHAYGIVGALVAVPLVSVGQSLLFFVRDEYSRSADIEEGVSDSALAADARTHEAPTREDAPAGREADESGPDEGASESRDDADDDDETGPQEL